MNSIGGRIWRDDHAAHLDPVLREATADLIAKQDARIGTDAEDLVETLAAEEQSDGFLTGRLTNLVEVRCRDREDELLWLGNPEREQDVHVGADIVGGGNFR